MVDFSPLGSSSPGAFPVGNQWRGRLLKQNKDGTIQKIAYCTELRDTQDLASQDARNLHHAISVANGPFDIGGFKFSLGAQEWEDGFRGHILILGHAGSVPPFEKSVEIQCVTYQATQEDAFFEAYFQAQEAINNGLMVRHLAERSGS